MTQKIIFSLVSLIAAISFAEPVVLTDRLEPLDERITTLENSYITSNNFPIATSETLGGVKVGDNLDIESDGTLSAPNKMVFYGTCSSPQGTIDNEVILVPSSDTNKFTFTDGVVLYVTFSASLSQSNPNFVINGQTNKVVRRANEGVWAGQWSAGMTAGFVYSDPYWRLFDGQTATSGLYGSTVLKPSATYEITGYSLDAVALNNYSSNSIFPYPVFSTSSNYNVGDKVRYNYNAWICTNAISSAGNWNTDNWKMIDPIQDQIEHIASNVSSLTWATQDVYIGITIDDNFNVDYHDGDVIQLQSENGSVQFFSEGNGGPASITLVLPELTFHFNYCSLTLFISECDDAFIRYNISSDNCYAPWFPSSQPWDSFNDSVIWKTKWESPPETEEWYFMGAEKYPR